MSAGLRLENCTTVDDDATGTTVTVDICTPYSDTGDEQQIFAVVDNNHTVLEAVAASFLSDPERWGTGVDAALMGINWAMAGSAPAMASLNGYGFGDVMTRDENGVISPVPVGGRSYSTAENLLFAAQVAGLPCDDWEWGVSDNEVVEGGICWDSGAQLFLITDAQALDTTAEEIASDGPILQGPNWLIQTDDFNVVAPMMGGTLRQ
ncbi:MAG: hypothetical protein LBB54_01545 [Cellulomonadaceae bacterium]|nr:hypothetical protein [Cellulomonadaceae bacterium]